MLHSGGERRMGRREDGFLFEIPDVALTFNRHWHVMSRERHHCASADVGTIVSRACVYHRRRRSNFMAVEDEARSWVSINVSCQLMSADWPPQPGDTSVSSEPAGGHIVTGNRFDAGKMQLRRRRSVSSPRKLRRRDARRYALLGGRWCQWYWTDNICKIMTITL